MKTRGQAPTNKSRRRTVARAACERGIVSTGMGAPEEVNALRRIMLDPDAASPRRRVEAAEHLLDYECPEAVVVECKESLTSVFEDSEQHVDIRLDALKLARKFEAAKVIPRTIRTARQDGDRREAWRRYEISQRHWKLSLAIKDTPPKGWADDLYADTYEAPEDGWPPWG